MDILKFIVGVILPYVALFVFVGGMAHRFHVWSKLAAPPMTLFPAPPDGVSNTLRTIQEAVLFKSLMKGDRLLWGLAWAFHAVLLLIFLGHFRVFLNIDALLKAAGMSEDAIGAMSQWAGGAAGLLILAATILLLARRLAVARVREITGAADYLALVLIGAIVITGNMMRFGGEAQPVVVAQAKVSPTLASAVASQQSESRHFDLAVAREYFAALATFSFSDPTPIKRAMENNLFVVHMCLALLLVLCMPFSKILHFGGIFFTHQLLRSH